MVMILKNGWQTMESVPRDGSPVLVWLEEPMLHSHVHVATFHPNITIIGGIHEFDAPKVLYWQPMVGSP